MKTAEQLRRLLQDIDHRSYPAYKDTKGSYQFPGYVLIIDHVQGDPFASPSKVSIRVEGSYAAFPEELYDTPHTRIALQDHLTRLFGKRIEERFSQREGQRSSYERGQAENFDKDRRKGQSEGDSGRGFASGSGKSGLITMSRCGQAILERTACRIEESGDILVRFEVGFPANGRTIQSAGLIRLFFERMPLYVRETLVYHNLDTARLTQIKYLAEDQQAIRELLPELGLCAFVAEGAILPRESGVSDRPMRQAVAFRTPKERMVTLTLPHRGKILGMGVPVGITLIVGGGYHGKSTLLEALEQGVYNHIAGDGREYVITDDTAVKIRAEDGRSVKKTDISLFISNLPNGRNTKEFYTEDASGSTSQAANMVEAMEAGAQVFLIDEDTSATNFMIRDELMQRVIHREKEPIIPFIERVRDLYRQCGISTILVAGSCGSYFHVADNIIQMDQYEPKDITKIAKEEARKFGGPPAAWHVEEANADFSVKSVRIKKTDLSASAGRRCPQMNREIREGNRVKLKTMGRDGFSINKETVDMRYVEQLIDSEQLTALSYYLKYAEAHLMDGKRSITEIIEELWERTQKEGMAFLSEGSYLPSGLARVRKQEVYACLNRYRGLRL